MPRDSPFVMADNKSLVDIVNGFPQIDALVVAEVMLSVEAFENLHGFPWSIVFLALDFDSILDIKVVVAFLLCLSGSAGWSLNSGIRAPRT